jgi:hypothetical protein
MLSGSFYLSLLLIVVGFVELFAKKQGQNYLIRFFNQL